MFDIIIFSMLDYSRLLCWYTIYLCVFLYIFKTVTCGRSKSKVCLVGKTAIITGANEGIGYQVALELASRGCRIIIADKNDSTKSKQQIIKETHNDKILTKYLDLSSFKSVREFAKDITNTEEKIDILINNAGIGWSPMIFTEDNLQITMQVNYFGPFLLTHLLTGLMKKSAPSRIVFTASFMAHMVKVNPKDLIVSKNYKDTHILGGIYSLSKLYTIIASDIFAEKLKGTHVTVNSLHPGGVRTGIFKTGFKKEQGGSRHIVGLVSAAIWGKSVEEGIQTTIHVATSNELENVTGKHYWDCKEMWKPIQASDKEFCDKIWKISEEVCGLKEHEKLK